MNNDKRIIALVSLGLLLAALLVPFFIALCGRDDLAIGFAAVAGLLALLFGAFSWSDRIGRTVTIALLLLLVGGGGGMTAIRALRSQAAVEPADGARRNGKPEPHRSDIWPSSSTRETKHINTPSHP